MLGFACHIEDLDGQSLSKSVIDDIKYNLSLSINFAHGIFYAKDDLANKLYYVKFDKVGFKEFVCQVGTKKNFTPMEAIVQFKAELRLTEV